MQLHLIAGDTRKLSFAWAPPMSSDNVAADFVPRFSISINGTWKIIDGTHADNQFELLLQSSFTSAIPRGEHDYAITLRYGTTETYTHVIGRLRCYGLSGSLDHNDERDLAALREAYSARVSKDPNIISYTTNHVNAGGMTVSKLSVDQLLSHIQRLENRIYWKRRGQWHKKL